IVKGFAANDPLSVGGGLLPDMPICHFEGGGWLLVDDLLNNFDLAPPYCFAGVPAVQPMSAHSQGRLNRQAGGTSASSGWGIRVPEGLARCGPAPLNAFSDQPDAKQS